MKEIEINELNISKDNIQKYGYKARAILLKEDKILVSNYGGVILLPGGSVDNGESYDETITRELKEETGVNYSINDLEKVLLIKYYQANYPTRDNQLLNRIITTQYYLGKYRGIDLNSIKRTTNEQKDGFCLKLIEIDELLNSINEINNNPRKKYFDTELKEVVKVLSKYKRK